MKEGKTLQQLATEVTALRNRSRDYRVVQNILTMDEDLNLRTPRIADGSVITVAPRELMHEQIADRLGVPSRYYQKMRTEAPELLRKNVNHWLAASGDRKLLRTYAPDSGKITTAGDSPLEGRAFLSGGYKPLENYDMLEAIVPPLMGSGLRVASSDITERRLYMQLVTDKIQAVVRMMRPGTHERMNDPIQMGLVVSNSEVGSGALSIQVLVYRLVCTNGLIIGEDLPGFRKVHLGRTIGDGDESLLSEETKRLTSAAIFAQARDFITAAVSQTTLDGIANRLNGVAAVTLQDPEKAVELVTKRFDLSEDEHKGVMANLIAGGDVSQWGLTNAVTRLANETPSYDRAIDLETIGGKIVGLSPSAFGNN